MTSLPSDSPASPPIELAWLDDVPIGVCVIDLDLRVHAWNRTLELWTGLPSNIMCHSDLGLRFPKLRSPKYYQRFREVAESGLPVLFSAALHRRVLDVPARNGSPGELMVQETWVKRVAGASGALLLMTIQDLTTEYRQLTELRNDRREMVRFQRELEKANQSLQSSLCLYARNNQRLQAEIQERAKIEQELRQQRNDLIAAKDREAEHAIWLEHMVKELTAARQQAETAAQTKSEFLANMSHEIRTPMTAILGYVELLREPDISEEEKLQAIETVQRNGQHLLAIINDILDISKIEAGRMTVERIPCSPRQIIEDILTLMSARAAEKKLDLKADYIGSIPEVIHTDPTRVRQILVNLIGNAIKFTSSGSVRVVSQMIVSPDGAPPRLRIDVIDTGIGIREDQVRNLFHPFTQADMTMSRQYGGTGLGLAISQRLARMLGGDITVASEYGRGSCFTVTLDPGAVVVSSPPNDAVGESAAPPPRPIAARVLENAHILIVDDAPDNRKLLSYHIKKAGGSFDLAENGEIAVNLVRHARCSRPYDAVLMDMQMPVLDGYQATAAIRNDGDRLPIIALTAHAMSGDREKCLDAGCDDFLTKPIDRVALIETLARYVAKPKAELTVFPL